MCTEKPPLPPQMFRQTVRVWYHFAWFTASPSFTLTKAGNKFDFKKFEQATSSGLEAENVDCTNN